MNDLNERLKIIRNLKQLTQKDFGCTLGVSRDTYASYESGRVIPSNTFIQLLCTNYNVNMDWLVNGKGEMFIESKEDYIDELVKKYNGDDVLKNVISAFLKLEKNERAIVLKFIDSLEPEPPVNEIETKQNIEHRRSESKIEIKKNLEKVEIFRASRSSDNTPPQRLEVPVERIKKLEDAEEADEI